MSEQIKQGWHRVLAALVENDIARADRERARVEAMVRVKRATDSTRIALRRVER